MKLSSQKLPSGKWGIYSNTGLLATVDSQAICETIMANLVSGRRDAPFEDVNALYQVPELRKTTRQSAGAHSTAAGRRGSQGAFVTAPKGKNLDGKSADSEVPKTAQVSVQSTVNQKTSKTAKDKTANEEAATEPLTGRAKARADGSAKRKRRSTRRTSASLAS